MSSITLHGASLFLSKHVAGALRTAGGSSAHALTGAASTREHLLDLASGYEHTQSSYSEDLRASALASH